MTPDLRPTRHVTIGRANAVPAPRHSGFAPSLFHVSAIRRVSAFAIRFLRYNALPLGLGFIAGVLAVLIPAMVIAQVIA